MELTDKQIEFGFNYDFKEEHDLIKSVVEVSEYNGEEKPLLAQVLAFTLVGWATCA